LKEEEEHSGGYAEVNGLKMYYEIHGDGSPLVLIPGGGSTIESTFGRVLPQLAGKHKVIAVEVQAHGRTPDIDRPFTFAQDADDVASLLEQLNIGKADIFGFSNGGTTSLQMAIRHPQIVNKLVLASACYKREGMLPGFFESFDNASIEQMPKPLQDAFLKVNSDQRGLQRMFERDVARMIAFEDINDIDIRSIRAPALVLGADRDVVRVEHAFLLSRTIPKAQLAILPGEHGDYIGEVCGANKDSKIPELVLAMIEEFLE
jgi:pimeloyl-ACP methyl ester carboxylesterase